MIWCSINEIANRTGMRHRKITLKLSVPHSLCVNWQLKPRYSGMFLLRFWIYRANSLKRHLDSVFISQNSHDWQVLTPHTCPAVQRWAWTQALAFLGLNCAPSLPCRALDRAARLIAAPAPVPWAPSQEEELPRRAETALGTWRSWRKRGRCVSL